MFKRLLQFVFGAPPTRVQPEAPRVPSRTQTKRDNPPPTQAITAAPESPAPPKPPAPPSAATATKSAAIDVFLSYAHDEREKVDVVAKALQALGMRTFLDVDGGVNAGDSFPQRLTDAVRDAKVVLACWSRRALTSDWVRRECMMARDSGKLVAAAVDTLAPTDLPAEFYGTSFEDLTGYAGEGQHWGWSQTCRALAERLESWADAHAGNAEASRSLDLASQFRKTALAARPEGAAPTGGVVAAASAAARAWQDVKDSEDWQTHLEFGKAFPNTEEGFLATKKGNELRKKAAHDFWLKCSLEATDQLQRELDYCKEEFGAINGVSHDQAGYQACRRTAFDRQPIRQEQCVEETRRRFGVEPN